VNSTRSPAKRSNTASGPAPKSSRKRILNFLDWENSSSRIHVGGNTSDGSAGGGVGPRMNGVGAAGSQAGDNGRESGTSRGGGVGDRTGIGERMRGGSRNAFSLYFGIRVKSHMCLNKLTREMQVLTYGAVQTAEDEPHTSRSSYH